MWRSAEKLNARALALEDRGKTARAEELYLEAIRKSPNWSVPWFNLGLLYKRQRRWPESLEHNRRATELDPSDEPSWWNLGIAATAIGDWATARDAWRGFGLDVPEGEGPLDLHLGLTPITLRPEAAGEVAWCKRIDPARAIVRSVPFADSERRFGDLVLHDGEPRGSRLLGGKEVSVFNEIELLEPSSFKTFSARVDAPEESDMARLSQLALEHDSAAEDWSAVKFICQACSEGRCTDRRHDDDSWKVGRIVGVAALTVEIAADILRQWVFEAGSRSFSNLEHEFG